MEFIRFDYKTIFYIKFNLNKISCVWQGQSFPHYNDWVQRIKDIYPFLFVADNAKRQIYLGHEIWNDYKTTSIDFSFVTSLSNADVIYALNKFLQSIQTGFNNE